MEKRERPKKKNIHREVELVEARPAVKTVCHYIFNPLSLTE